MIQRIQSIYLFLVAIGYILLCCFPLATSLSSTFALGSFIPYTALCFLCALLPLIIIGLYKKRILQIRLSVFHCILCVFTPLSFLLYCYFSGTQPSAYHYHWTSVIPFISIILDILSIRAIGKDEALVRSMDRLR